LRFSEAQKALFTQKHTSLILIVKISLQEENYDAGGTKIIGSKSCIEKILKIRKQTSWNVKCVLYSRHGQTDLRPLWQNLLMSMDIIL
jgi:hypothetical protein